MEEIGAMSPPTEVVNCETKLRLALCKCTEAIKDCTRKESIFRNNKDKKKKKSKREQIPRFNCKKLCIKNPTLKQIGGSVKHSCGFGCKLMMTYLGECCRFFTAFALLKPPTDTEFQEMAYDMLRILKCLGRDCLYFIRYILRLLTVSEC